MRRAILRGMAVSILSPVPRSTKPWRQSSTTCREEPQVAVFPLSKVKRLSDFQGLFYLSVQCLACNHDRPIAARELASKCGYNAPVAGVVKRLRCGQCGGREVDVRVVGIPR